MAPITWPGKIIAPRSKRKTLRVTRAVMKFIWANYNDLFPPSSHLKLWFCKGIPLKSPKHSRFRNDINLPRFMFGCSILGDSTQLYGGIGCFDDFFGLNWMYNWVVLIVMSLHELFE